MLYRAYKRLDGSIAIIVPNEKCRLKGETDAQFISRIAAQDAPKSNLDQLPYEDIDSKDLPIRSSRKDWTLNKTTKKIEVKQRGN